MMKVIHGEKYSSKEILKQMIDKKIQQTYGNSAPYSIDQFLEMCAQNPVVMSPLLRLQLEFRAKLIGENFWARLCNRRYENEAMTQPDYIITITEAAMRHDDDLAMKKLVGGRGVKNNYTPIVAKLKPANVHSSGYQESERIQRKKQHKNTDNDSLASILDELPAGRRVHGSHSDISVTVTLSSEDSVSTWRRSEFSSGNKKRRNSCSPKGSPKVSPKPSFASSPGNSPRASPEGGSSPRSSPSHSPQKRHSGSSVGGNKGISEDMSRHLSPIGQKLCNSSPHSSPRELKDKYAPVDDLLTSTEHRPVRARRNTLM